MLGEEREGKEERDWGFPSSDDVWVFGWVGREMKNLDIRKSPFFC